jgi:formyltetrahydrofolate synthetase
VSEEEIEKAYQRGLQDANLQMDQKINYLANEVYESVQGHLDHYQKQKIEQSNQEVLLFFLLL